MELITKQYIVDENNRKIAVQIPIEDFEKIEQLLEDYALFHLMKDNQGTELLDQTDAETYYKQLVKKDFSQPTGGDRTDEGLSLVF